MWHFNRAEQVSSVFTFDFDYEIGSAISTLAAVLRRGGFGGRRMLYVMSVSTGLSSVTENQSYLAVMRLINVAMPVLTEWTQGTCVAVRCTWLPLIVTPCGGHTSRAPYGNLQRSP